MVRRNTSGASHPCGAGLHDVVSDASRQKEKSVSDFPVAVGGVGGSGTRLIAQFLIAAGFHLGTDQNTSFDNLWFTLLFKRREILTASDSEFNICTSILQNGIRGGHPLTSAEVAMVYRLAENARPQNDLPFAREHADSLIAAASGSRWDGCWGWKEPNTHIVIDRLWLAMPQLRYVHVVRHGVDMALSDNQNQLKLWGENVLGGSDYVSPSRSLMFWCAVQRRAQQLQADNPHRMYWLDFDAFCASPEVEVRRLFEFIGKQPGNAWDLLPTVRVPKSRHQTADLSQFRAEDLRYVWKNRPGGS